MEANLLNHNGKDLYRFPGYTAPMSHTAVFQKLQQIIRLSQHGPSSGENYSRPSRRAVLKTGLGALSAVPSLLSARKPPNIDVGIVGAGLAGLSCGWELHRRGVAVTVYEAESRVGGRCYSMGSGFPGPVSFPGQVVERGGEFIDTGHKTMLRYAKEFRLDLEDVTKFPGATAYYFDGHRVAESAVVEEFRSFVTAMRRDLRSISKAPSAASHTPADRAMDLTSLAEYLVTRGAGRLVRKAIEEAYVAEYGLEPDQQSCLNFLLFVHADRRSKFRPFGVFSDERYHILQGNQAVPDGLASRLAGRIRNGHVLEAVRKTASGRVELRFGGGTSSVHDAVVLAIPFTVLRQVDLDPSLDLPAWKTSAIQELGYGTNAKMMVGFSRRTWADTNSNGSSYSDLLHHQTTWETNPKFATAQRAVLTDYSGGHRGAGLNPGQLQAEAGRFLDDLDSVFPGASADAVRGSAGYLAHLEHWPSNPRSVGSYTCYLPGQFTTIAGNEGTPVGNLFFAGEHANSFYEWQGFMEGALLSGVAAAEQILK